MWTKPSTIVEVTVCATDWTMETESPLPRAGRRLILCYLTGRGGYSTDPSTSLPLYDINVNDSFGLCCDAAVASFGRLTSYYICTPIYLASVGIWCMVMVWYMVPYIWYYYFRENRVNKKNGFAYTSCSWMLMLEC